MPKRKKNKSTNSPLPGSFNGIANKFDQNIYGTTKGQLRHQLLLHYLHDYLHGPKLKVLDAGGGTGIMSYEFAKLGHDVVLVDVSDDALAIATERLSECKYMDIQHCELQAIQGEYDLILCHAVLEWLDEPQACLSHLWGLLKPKGMLSLSFFNQDAKIFNNLLYGNFDYVQDGLPNRNTVRLNPHNAQKPLVVLDCLNAFADLSIQCSAGLRCFHDYISDKTKIDEQFDKLVAMEKLYGTQAPYKWLGKYFYIQALRKQVV